MCSCERSRKFAKFAAHKILAKLGFGPLAQLVSSTWLIIRGSLVRTQQGPHEASSPLARGLLYSLPTFLTVFQWRWATKLDLLRMFKASHSCVNFDCLPTNSPTTHWCNIQKVICNVFFSLFSNEFIEIYRLVISILGGLLALYLIFNRESNDNQYLNNLLSVIILSSCFHFIRNFLISSGKHQCQTYIGHKNSLWLKRGMNLSRFL